MILASNAPRPPNRFSATVRSTRKLSALQRRQNRDGSRCLIYVAAACNASGSPAEVSLV